MPPAVDPTDSQIRKRKGIESHLEHCNMHKANNSTVSVHLSDVDGVELYPDRIVVLEYPHWTVEIGRGSSSEATASPQPGNAWFTSKVMSRHHAELKADPQTKMLIIKDNGSMHGTLLNGEKIPRSGLELLPEDIITFGTPVQARENTFAPLKASVSYNWTEDDETRDIDHSQPSFKNTFTADYSDADVYSEYEDEKEIVHDSVRQPSIEVLDTTFVQTLAASSTSTSPRTNSERRPSSSVTLLTDTSSAADEGEDKQRGENMAPAKAKVPPVSDDNDLKTIERLDHSPKAMPGPSEESIADEESSQGYSQSENYSELRDYDDDYDDEEEYDQEEEEEEDHEMHDDDGFYPEALKVSYCPSVPVSVPLRDPSPSDAAMAKPRPVSPARMPLFASALAPPPPPPPPAFAPENFLSSPPDKTFAEYAVPQTPAPATQSNFPCLPLYRCPPHYPTISNDGPFGYTITPYDSYSTSYLSPQPSFPAHLPTTPPQPFTCSHKPLSMPELAKSTDEGPKCYQPEVTLKRKADEMSDTGDASDWSSDKQVQDLKTLSPPRSPEIVPGSPVWHPGSPEIPGMQINAAVERDEGLNTVNEATQHVVFIQELEAPEAEARMRVERSAVSDEAESAMELAEPIVSVVSAAECEKTQPPPRKKAKIGDLRLNQTGSTARTAMKYAAVALAGGAAGALGTVYALASLPSDYFASAL